MPRPRTSTRPGSCSRPAASEATSPSASSTPTMRIRSPSPTAVTLPDCAADADPQRPAPRRRPLRAAARAGGERRARAARVARRRTGPSGPAGTDAIAVFGGGMNVADAERLPWLDDEIELLRDALEAGVPVLGVCLGAQLLAAAAGAEVRRADRREIGWFDVERTAAGAGDPLLGAAAGALHRLPVALVRRSRCPTARSSSPAAPSARRPTRSASAWGVQFHPEVTRTSSTAWIADCRQRSRCGRAGLRRASARTGLPERLAAWNALGRTLFDAWLAAAARVTAQLELRRGLGRRRVEQLRALDARAVDRGVGRRGVAAARRRAARAARQRGGVELAAQPRGLLLGTGQHARHAVVDRRADRVGARGEDRRRTTTRSPATRPRVPQAGERERRAAVDRVAERDPRLPWRSPSAATRTSRRRATRQRRSRRAQQLGERRLGGRRSRCAR